MLYYLTTAEHPGPIWDIIRSSGWRNLPFLQPLTYEALFHSRKAPRGHYIFTDFDRLTAYEVQCAARIAEAVQAADPNLKIYNHPGRTLERVPLLSRLYKAGINSFNVTRIDTGDRPTGWPVFIRCEDDCKRPDTGLLNNDAEYDAALADMAARGIPLKRRIAVQYRAELSPDGFYRKYGAFRVGGRIVLQHILRNADWYVKHGQIKDDDAARLEFTQLFDNFAAHASQLEAVFALAGIDYGRVDYSIVNGRIEVYEINTNPVLRGPGRRRPGGGGSLEKQKRTVPMLIGGFRAMNPPHASGGAIRFELPKPVFQHFPGLDLYARAKWTAYNLEALRTAWRQPINPLAATTAPSRKSVAQP